MKKLLFIFLLGQMLIISFLFGNSIYNIYILNNLVDSRLEAYKISEASAEKLSVFYDSFIKENENLSLAIVKMPVTDDESTTVYNVYHTNVANALKQVSINRKDVINYYSMTKDEFIDSTGLFYTDMPLDKLKKIGSRDGINIESTKRNLIDYKQVFTYNLVNSIVMLGVTILIIFVYAFSRNKINAVKSMLGYNILQMVRDSIIDFFQLELIVLLMTFLIHILYLSFKSVIVPRYFLGLFITCSILILINLFIVSTTCIIYRRINFSEVLKNKVYTPIWNMILKGAKIAFMIGVTLSVSIFITNFKDFRASQKSINKYKGLNRYFTSNGFNSNTIEKLDNNPELLVSTGYKVKSVYKLYDKQNKVIAINAPVLMELTPTYLEMHNLKPEDILNDINKNYAVLNNHYINDYLNLEDIQGNRIKISKDSSKPQLLVPEVYKSKEDQIKEVYIEKINDLIRNDIFYLKEDKKNYKLIRDVEITYYKSGQVINILSQQDEDKIDLVNTIIIVDEGNFAGTYYLEILGNFGMAFEFNDRSEFSQLLLENGLEDLYYSSTLLTPYLARIRNYEFIMSQSFVFSVLFAVTLLFILFISNKVDMTIHRKELASRFILGDSMHNQMKFNYLVTFIVFLFVVPLYILGANIAIYVCILMIDFFFMIYSYNMVIKKDIVNIMKGA
ncbi:MAG: hypothetical protein GX206_13340 [Clostridiales bacterium]|nr:hypothetical protein [Clostridiales bacterium]